MDRDPPGSARSVGARLARRVATGLRRRLGRDRPAACEIDFEGHGSGSFTAGTTLLDAARQLGVDLDHFCGGNNRCGTCRVEIIAGADHLNPPEGNERMVLGAAHVHAGHRLACQTRARGPVVVRVPRYF